MIEFLKPMRHSQVTSGFAWSLKSRRKRLACQIRRFAAKLWRGWQPTRSLLAYPTGNKEKFEMLMKIEPSWPDGNVRGT